MARYMFIDGASLQKTCRWFEKEIYNAENLPYDFGAVRLLGEPSKIFYYDCLPPRGESEAEDSYNFRSAQQQTLFDKLHGLDGWHVRQGIAKRGRGKQAPSQKEVDILIAVDMLGHTFRRTMDSVVFITSDLDFRPLLEEVGRWGISTTLYYQIGHTNEDLIHAADIRRPITASVHSQWVSRAAALELPHRRPILRRPHLTPVEMVSEGRDCRLYNQGDSFQLVSAARTGGGYESWSHKDGELLKRCFAVTERMFNEKAVDLFG